MTCNMFCAYKTQKNNNMHVHVMFYMAVGVCLVFYVFCVLDKYLKHDEQAFCSTVTRVNLFFFS